MKKQRRRIYAALLCSSMVLSLVSTPVSAAETGQLTNPPTSTEELGSLESASGNEAAAALNGLYAALPVANGVKEVATAEELTGALADSSISGITLKRDIDIGSTLTVNRTVTLDLNGCVLKMTGGGSVIKVESDGNLTIADSNKTTQHNFNPNCKYLTWYIDMWKLDKDGTEIVSGGVITGGGGDFVYNDGGGVLVNAGGTLTMTGGSIVGCSAGGLGGGVRLAYDSAIGKSSTFTLTGGSIIGCAAQIGGGVYVASGCTFVMATSSNIHNCIANNDGGGVINHGTFKMYGGTISACTTVAFGGGGVCNKGTFIMSDGMIKGCTSPDGQYASGGGVRNSNQFTMTGGTIGDPDNENDASHVYNTSSQETTLTISGNAKIYTDVTNVGILNADGGEMSGTVTNGNEYGTGTITGSENAAGSTEFPGKITNNGTIRNGTFTNEVINESSGAINGGTFTGTVENRGGTISGGDFSGTTLPVKLMITFEPNNGEPVITQEVNWSKDGAALTAPASAKEGHSLDGWYYDNNGTETKWNFDTDTVKCTMTLRAKWTKNTTPIVPGNGTNNIVEQYKTDDSNSGEQTDREVPSPVVKNTTSYLTYTVQAGDTLWKIARKYNCSITEIMAANSDRIKNPNRIHAGWQLKIPQSGAPITGGTPDAVLPENKKSGIYIVRQGDTLWKIARKYGCSVAEIVSLNRELIRDPALIYSGWELKVPQN